jgi:hypothetical protein
MARRSITYTRGISVGDTELASLGEIIGFCMAALNKKQIHSLEKTINDLLVEIQYNYYIINQKIPDNNYPKLIKETLKTYDDNHQCESRDYYEYFRVSS